jgi:hypothetical protein
MPSQRRCRDRRGPARLLMCHVTSCAPRVTCAAPSAGPMSYALSMSFSRSAVFMPVEHGSSGGPFGSDTSGLIPVQRVSGFPSLRPYSTPCSTPYSTRTVPPTVPARTVPPTVPLVVPMNRFLVYPDMPSASCGTIWPIDRIRSCAPATATGALSKQIMPWGQSMPYSSTRCHEVLMARRAVEHKFVERRSPRTLHQPARQCSHLPPVLPSTPP